MPIASLAAFRTGLTSGREIISANVNSVTVVAGRPFDLWVPSAPAGVAPSAAVVPTNNTIGALGQRDAGASLQNSILGYRLSALNPGVYLVCDRLSHQGGLSGTVFGAPGQTTNLPTAALTRYTGGEGVMLGLTIYSAVGGTATTVTASYTNQAGAGSRTTVATQFGGAGFNNQHRMIMLPLQDGDTGVRSVQSVTLAASTTTAGNFGVTLFRPLYVLCVESTSGVSSGGFVSGLSAGGIPVAENGACLFLMSISAGANAACAGTLILEEN